jgi:formylmethanofuran dehydrogenase subunit D
MAKAHGQEHTEGEAKEAKLSVRKGGCIHLNATFISKYGFKEGDAYKVDIEKGKIVITKEEK